MSSSKHLPLFSLMGKPEAIIREDPVGQGDEMLKRLFSQ
ncbi:hypothetical protein SAMN05421693_13219 [Ectothiorhodospira magna]|uniref:Uncharacterized protein n=1 Tax=Ectothiorhodospira magna TaxID=867345 RepID=A0A1H9G3X9_9GAMM|nr:hypothetical protein SAMN05421693_13219 [Ectothiorhodospira magna]